MSRYDYERGRILQTEPFYGLIQAAMRIADTRNQQLLRDAFPRTWRELHQRYNNPDGMTDQELREHEKAIELASKENQL